MKKLDRREIIQIRDALLEDYNDLRKDKNPMENLEVQETILASQINILSYVLGHSFNIFRGETQSTVTAPDIMYTKSIEQ